MKKTLKKKVNLLLLISLVSAPFLASCNEEKATEEIAIPQYVYEEISKASLSYKLRAQETETISKKSGEVMVKNQYQYDVTNVHGESTGVSKTISKTTSSGFYSSSYSYIKGSRGYIAEEILNYKNEIEEMEVFDENNSRIVYEREFANPFSFITSGDIASIEGEENSFALKEEKRQLFASYLLSPGYEIDNCTFIFEDEKLTKLSLSSPTFDIVYQDAYTSNYIESTLKYDLDVRLSDVGCATYQHLQKEASKNPEKEATLKTALTNMGTNYTMIMNTHYQDEKPNTEYDSYWYFDGGSAVYHQQTGTDTSKRFDLYYKKDLSKSPDLLYLYDYNEETNKWDYYEPIAAASYNVDPQPYSYFTPVFQEVAPELFTYDETNDKYVCKNKAALGYLGNAFLGGGYKTSYFTLGQGNQAEIYLNKDKTKVSKVVVGYEDIDSEGYDVSRSFTMTFIDIGTTKIPSFVEG